MKAHEMSKEERALEVNSIIMREVGFEIGKGSKVYDQDTGMPVVINGMSVVAPGGYNGTKTIAFDPYNNRKMMSQVFGYFADKHAEESGKEVVAFYVVGSGSNTAIECKMNDNSTIRSKPYIRDSLKYADLIMQMNNDSPDTEDLSKYDVVDTIKKKTTKRDTKPAAGKKKEVKK